ncbi:MAG: hypothetical protein IKP43_11645 [Bacteroidaceae bacterium]|nr:hypothetical protein [Bacteroidaceae bacterium]
MPGKVIKELRMMGLLDEALAMALEEWKAAPEDEKTKTNLAWVYFAFCKRYTDAELNYAKFVETFDKLSQFDLFSTNNVLSNSIATCIVKLLSKVDTFDDLDKKMERCDELFSMVKQLNIDKTEDVYYDIFERFYDYRDTWESFSDFCQWWGLEYLRPQDFHRQTLRVGKKMVVSMGEGAYIACAKRLLNEYERGLKGVSDLNNLIGKLDIVIDQYKGLYWLEYYKYKLMLKRDDSDEVMQTFLPIVKKRSSEFWTWQLMSEIFADDEEKHVACMLRASSCKAKEVFLSPIRFKLAKYMIEHEDYVGARYEIEQFLYGRQFGDYGVPDEVKMWVEMPWFKNAQGTSTVMSMPFRQITDSILASDLPVLTGVVTYVNQEKKIATLVYDYQRNAFFKFSDSLEGLQSGDVVKFKAEFKAGGENVKVVSAQIIDSMPETDFYRTVKGTVSTNFLGTSFFLNTDDETIYVPNTVFDNNDVNRSLYVGDEITCRVAYAYNRKQDRWNWVVVRIIRDVND